MSRFPFVILAGKPEKRDALLQQANLDNKIFISYRRRTLIEILLLAIADSRSASSILIVGVQEHVVPLPNNLPPVEFLEIEGPQYDKIHQAAIHITDNPGTFGDVSRVVYTSADQPLANGEAIQHFIAGCGDCVADFYYPVVPKSVAIGGLVDFPWGYMKIKSGRYVSGTYAMIDPFKLREKYDMIKFLSENRKSFVWGVLKASPWMFLKLIFGRITIEETERLMTSYFGVESKLVISTRFELGVDIDTPEHLEYFRKRE